MKKLKYEILFVILFITVGIAAVSSNLLINGSTPIAANIDDFEVYFSDVTSEKEDTYIFINTSKNFNITTTLQELNEEDKVNFKVTNSSQNYDAEVEISCTGENDYLKLTPYISSSTVPARGEIDGYLIIKMIKTYVGASKENNITCTINANAIEKTSISNGTDYTEKEVMLKSYSSRNNTGFEEYGPKVRTITFENAINIPDNAIGAWDFGIAENGNVMAYIVANEDDDYYDLYIQSDEQLYANPDMSRWFSDLYFLVSINNLSLLDTSKVTNMNSMFASSYSLEAIPGINELDTTKVTDMSNMFYNSAISDLDLSGWYTGNVTNMSEMFNSATEISNLDLSDWDTSKVTNMSYMFENCGITELNLNGWDTSKVTDMSGMFTSTINLTNLDLSSFNTSKVTDMSYMFQYSNVSTLNISNFDTSKVANMELMFANTSYIKTSITIRNPEVNYTDIFLYAASDQTSQITLNYTQETSLLVDEMIDSIPFDANVVKGTLIE